MRFIRNARMRDRVIDFVSKAILIGVSLLVCLWMVSGARAGTASDITGIKAQALDDGSYAVDFALSQKVEKDSVNVEFERNFIQVSFRGVSAYPARTENANTGLLEKVFTYQYQPDLARARVLLKTDAATVKSRTSWELTKEGLRILVKGAKAPVASAAPAAIDAEEEKIVKEIIEKGTSTSSAVAKKAADAPANIENQPVFSSSSASGDKPENRPHEGAATRVFASLLLVIGVIGATAAAYRRFVLGKGMAFPRQEKVIHVVASQALGPKRSIAIVKVLDQFLVVGMCGDGMNLLANLGSDVKIEKFLDQAGPGASFGDSFEAAMMDPSPRAPGNPGTQLTQRAGVDLGIRGTIKKRLEGFKPL